MSQPKSERMIPALNCECLQSQSTFFFSYLTWSIHSHSLWPIEQCGCVWQIYWFSAGLPVSVNHIGRQPVEGEAGKTNKQKALCIGRQFENGLPCIGQVRRIAGRRAPCKWKGLTRLGALIHSVMNCSGYRKARRGFLVPSDTAFSTWTTWPSLASEPITPVTE